MVVGFSLELVEGEDGLFGVLEAYSQNGQPPLETYPE